MCKARHDGNTLAWTARTQVGVYKDTNKIKGSFFLGKVTISSSKKLPSKTFKIKNQLTNQVKINKIKH